MDVTPRVATGRLLSNNPRQQDGVKQNLRVGAYGDLVAMLMGQGKINLADEGSYFSVNNAQTGLATAAAPTTFSATNPFLIIYNKDTVKNIYLDYAALVATAAGTAGASVQAAVVLDNGNRFASGGSEITANIVNSNGLVGAGSIAKVYAGNLTASAASSAARTIVGQRALKGAIPVAGDNYIVKFGSDDVGLLISTATLTWSSQPVPPLVVGPNMSALLHIWLPSQSAASSFIPEAAWYER